MSAATGHNTNLQAATEATLTEALRGERIYGDDFTPAQIAAWYEDEREGYANLYAEETGPLYPYHQQNTAHGFDAIPRSRRFEHALGFGAAYGDELLPIIRRIRRVTVIDPSEAFVRKDVGSVPATWVKPDASGVIPFGDGAFDLITCFGVLHHIPNVTKVLGELWRVLSPDGYALIREPIVSMGNWTRPRHGLTKRERGLPLTPFLAAVDAAGFHAQRRHLCMFTPFQKACRAVGIAAMANPGTIRADALLARLFKWNYTYHASWTGKKFTPTSVFLVLRKGPSAG